MDSLTRPYTYRFIRTFCVLLDFPNNGISCSRNDSNVCVECKTQGEYITGEDIDSDLSVGLIITYTLWVLLALTAVFGCFANVIVILVSKRLKADKSFGFLLSVLAYINLFSEVMSIISATAIMAYFGNWFGRGKFILLWIFISLPAVLFGRSLSVFTTILISIQCFLIISFSDQAKLWFSLPKTRLMTIGIVFLSVLVNIPRFFGWRLDENIWKNVPSLEHLEYIIIPSTLGKFFYHTLYGIHNHIDFWMPLPTLLIFNILSYLKVRQLTKRRKELNLCERQNVRAVRMFLPVIIVYFLVNIQPIVYIFNATVKSVIYREERMLLFLCIALDSAVNLPIYFYRSASFRLETRKLFWQWSERHGLQRSSKRKSNVETVSGSVSYQS